MVEITVVELFIGIPLMYCPTLEISSMSDHAAPYLGILSTITWFAIAIYLTAASFPLFRPRSYPRRPSSPIPPLVPLFIIISYSDAAASFTLDTALLRTTSTSSPGSDSQPPVYL